MAIACDSTPPPKKDGGGNDGAVTCPEMAEGGAVDPNMVSDFEDGFGSVLQQGTPPRNGGWYAYNEELAGCNETPAAHAPMPAATMIEGDGRCGSKYAFRFFGSGCTMFVGVGTDLAAPMVDADAGTDAGAADAGTASAPKAPYDLSGYKQVKFFGRLGATAIPAAKQLVQFKLPMRADTKIVDGGNCDPAKVGANKCSASYGKFVTFTPEWQEFTIDLIPLAPGKCPETTKGICQETWGQTFTWDPTDVTSIQIQTNGPPPPSYDIWIDDLSLVPGP